MVDTEPVLAYTLPYLSNSGYNAKCHMNYSNYL